MLEGSQEHHPDPIDHGLDRMHAVIESQTDPAHKRAREKAKAHLAELKALHAKRDSGRKADAKASAVHEAESLPESQDLDLLKQERAKIEQEIEALTLEMRKLGNELGKYMSQDEAIPYIIGQKKIGARQKFGALLLGTIANSNVLIEKLRTIHESREQLKRQKEEIAQQIGRQEMLDMMQ